MAEATGVVEVRPAVCLLGELTLLVEAGLSPPEALAATHAWPGIREP